MKGKNNLPSSQEIFTSARDMGVKVGKCLCNPSPTSSSLGSMSKSKEHFLSRPLVLCHGGYGWDEGGGASFSKSTFKSEE